jgi:hypothetical protein
LTQIEPQLADGTRRNWQEQMILPSLVADVRAGEDSAKLRGELMQMLRQDFLK